MFIIRQKLTDVEVDSIVSRKEIRLEPDSVPLSALIILVEESNVVHRMSRRDKTDRPVKSHIEEIAVRKPPLNLDCLRVEFNSLIMNVI